MYIAPLAVLLLYSSQITTLRTEVLHGPVFVVVFEVLCGGGILILRWRNLSKQFAHIAPSKYKDFYAPGDGSQGAL